MRGRSETLSSSICSEVLYTLERIFGGPDEPDLGFNVSYLTACRSLSRPALAEPWEVPHQTVEAIRNAVARIEEMRDRRLASAAASSAGQPPARPVSRELRRPPRAGGRPTSRSRRR